MRMSQKQLRDAVASAGAYELIEDDEDQAASVEADAAAASERSYTTETVDELRQRYLGDSAVSDDAMLVGASAEPDESDDAFEDEIVVVRPKGPRAAFGHGPGPKSIVISGKDGKPLGAQG